MPFGGFGLIVATLCVGLAVGCGAGFVNAVPVVRLNLPPFITTLAMMLMARGLAFKLAHGQPVPVRSDAFESSAPATCFHGLLAPLHLPGIPIAVLWMAAIFIVFGVLLARTRFGRYVYAIGGNEEAARLAGINVAAVKTAVYMISGGCAAVSGLLLMSRFSSGSPQTGIGTELQSIAAVVVGGTRLMGGRGSIVGTFSRRALDRRAQQRDEPGRNRVLHAGHRPRRRHPARRRPRRTPQALPRALSPTEGAPVDKEPDRQAWGNAKGGTARRRDA